MLKKLRLKFIGITMLLVLVMLSVIFGMLFHFTKANLEEKSLHLMQTLADNSFRIRRPGEQTEHVDLPYFTLQLGIHGELVATGGGYFDLSDRDYLLSVMEAAFAAKTDVGVLEAYNLRFQRTNTPMSHCLVFVDMSSEQATLRDLVRNCVLIGLLTLLVFFGISLLLARWVVKPVETAWEQQKRFVADASHELKTPLTVIMTNAELLQEDGYEQEDRAKFAGSILTMSRQMRGLVEGLLEQARVDHGAAKLQKQRLCLTRLVEDALLPFEPLYFEKEVTIRCAAEPNLYVMGSRDHLRQVVEILLDNALKYTEPHGQVEVELSRHSGGNLLTVRNPGAALSKEELQHIFKRFYRADKARAMSGSYGLGLSIADTIVQAHNGKIWAESCEGFNTFCVQLPAVKGE